MNECEHLRLIVTGYEQAWQGFDVENNEWLESSRLTGEGHVIKAVCEDCQKELTSKEYMERTNMTLYVARFTEVDVLEHVQAVMEKNWLPDILNRSLTHLNMVRVEFTIDTDRKVIVLKNYKDVGEGKLMMLQAHLAVKISNWYREQNMPHSTWALECKEQETEFEEEEKEIDLEEMGQDRAADKDGWADR